MARRDRLSAWWRGLSVQLILGVALVHAVLIPVFVAGILFLVSHQFQQDFVERTRSNARLVGELVEMEYEIGRDPTALLQRVMINPDLIYARISDNEGNALAELGNYPETGRSRESFFFGQYGDGVYHIAIPLVDKRDHDWARLRLGFDEALTQEQVSQVYWRGLSMAAGYVVLTLGFLLWWVTRLNQPLRELRRLSRRVASGDYEAPLRVRTGLQEIRDLVGDLNFMRARLVKKTQSLEHMALHDALTGLPNRTLLADRLDRAVAEGGRSGETISLLILDLDHFKEVNDTLGHHVGDLLLIQAAGRLQEIARRGADTVARLGGDEFAIVLRDTDESQAFVMAEELCRLMRKAFDVEMQRLTIGLSVGIAMFPAHGSDTNELFRRADVAMYAAKNTGREYAMYSSQQDHHSVDKLALANDLHHAVSNNELELYYQAKMDLSSSAIYGYECLIRWEHPDRGLLMPADFIPMAEKTGSMDALTGWVVKTAFQMYADNRFGLIEDGLDLSVNLSARNLVNSGLPDDLGRLSKYYGVDPQFITLELTENELMMDPGHGLLLLNQIHDLGFRVSIDDFGTGYSSLEYLKRLPVDELKIDLTFISDMHRSAQDSGIVEAIIAMAHTLRLHVVAEGVENEEVMSLLRDMGCDAAQGFFVARPVPLSEIGRISGRKNT